MRMKKTKEGEARRISKNKKAHKLLEQFQYIMH